MVPVYPSRTCRRHEIELLTKVERRSGVFRIEPFERIEDVRKAIIRHLVEVPNDDPWPFGQRRVRTEIVQGPPDASRPEVANERCNPDATLSVERGAQRAVEEDAITNLHHVNLPGRLRPRSVASAPSKGAA